MNARFSNPRRGLGSAAFNPGIARAQAAGVTMSATPYPTGDAGIQTSLAVVAKKIREGRHDPAINGWVAQVFKARGIDGRDHPSVRTQVGALLDELRSSVIYLPDALGSEVIQSASATLCLAPGLCLNAGDCDDLSVALGAAALRAGIPVRAVHQIFYGAGTEHVLIQVQDERGKWLYADPSTRLPMGEAHRADKENYIDVMDGAPPELVTIGRPDHARETVTLGAASLPKGAAHASHPPPAAGMPTHRQFSNGRWWGWDGGAWGALPVSSSCAAWGEPLEAPESALVAEAKAQLEASGGAPVSETWNGSWYLFESTAYGVTIRPCTGATSVGLTAQDVVSRSLRAHGGPGMLGAAREGLGDTRVAWASLVTSEIQRVDAIYQATNNDATLCSVNGIVASNVFADWQIQLANWNAFVLAHQDLSNFQFGLGAILDQVEAYEKLVYDWQVNLKAAGCSIGAPIQKPVPEKDKPQFGPIFADGTAGELDKALGAVEKVLLGGAVVAAVGTGLWLAWPWLAALRAREGAAPRSSARENPIDTGTALAVGALVAGGVGAIVYAATRPTTAAAATPAPSPLPALPPVPSVPLPALPPAAPLPGTGATVPLVQGHEYQMTFPASSPVAAMSAATLQATLNASRAGVYTVKSVTRSGTSVVAVVDVVGMVPAGAVIASSSAASVVDLGPIPTPPNPA
jgi:hypothetical protein